MRKLVFGCLLTGLVIGCQSGSTTSKPKPPPTVPANPPPKGPDDMGDPVKPPEKGKAPTAN